MMWFDISEDPMTQMVLKIGTQPIGISWETDDTWWTSSPSLLCMVLFTKSWYSSKCIVNLANKNKLSLYFRRISIIKHKMGMTYLWVVLLLEYTILAPSMAIQKAISVNKATGTSHENYNWLVGLCIHEPLKNYCNHLLLFMSTVSTMQLVE